MYMTYYYPESFPISMLTWWIYFLIFDIWLETMLPNKKEKTIIVDKEDKTPN